MIMRPERKARVSNSIPKHDSILVFSFLLGKTAQAASGDVSRHLLN